MVKDIANSYCKGVSFLSFILIGNYYYADKIYLPCTFIIFFMNCVFDFFLLIFLEQELSLIFLPYLFFISETDLLR